MSAEIDALNEMESVIEALKTSEAFKPGDPAYAALEVRIAALEAKHDTLEARFARFNKTQGFTGNAQL